MDISQITEHLFVSAQPVAEDAQEILARNVRLVISMRGESLPPKCLRQPPFQFLWLRSYDTWVTPIATSHLVKVVQAAQQAIADGGRVLVYCQRGRHRSVIMAAAILIASGHTAEEAMKLLRSQREIADPQSWYVRRQIVKFERDWKKASAKLSAGK
jgi:protein-tyrosine phosphatase